jgi:hypothetical protein
MKRDHPIVHTLHSIAAACALGVVLTAAWQYFKP